MTTKPADYDALENRLLQMRLPPAFNSMVLTEAAYAIRDLRAERAALREALALARTVLVVACGEKAPYIKIALERIDAALAAQEQKPSVPAPPVALDDSA